MAANGSEWLGVVSDADEYLVYLYIYMCVLIYDDICVCKYPELCVAVVDRDLKLLGQV